MIKRFSLFAVFLGLIIINACSEGKLYKNNKEHVKLGQTFVGKFYKEVSKNKFDKAATFFSASVTKTALSPCSNKILNYMASSKK